MSQQDVIKVLERENEWMTSAEIAEVLNVSVQAIRLNLKRLFDHQEVQKREKPTKRGLTYIFKIPV